MLRRVEALDVIYERSNSVVIHPDEYYSYAGMGYKESPNSHGDSRRIRMVKGAKVNLVFRTSDNPERHVQNVSMLVYDAYKKSRLSEKQANDFFADVKSGKIKLLYSDEFGTLTRQY